MTMISNLTSAAAAMRPRMPAAGQASGNASGFDEILKDFTSAASKTPGERAAGEVLRKHGITKEQLGRLPASERDTINKEMAEAVKRVSAVEDRRRANFIGVA